MSRLSQSFRAALKNENFAGTPPAPASRVAAGLLGKRIGGTHLDEVLGPESTLVPAPRSAPMVSGGLWPARNIAEALVEKGLGGSVLSCLSRTVAVPKAAYAARGGRPTARLHYDTFRVDLGLDAPTKIVVVDDFVTKGATLLAAASRLREAFPIAEIAVFAIFRTLGLQPEIADIFDPCVGTIRLRGNDAWRDP